MQFAYTRLPLALSQLDLVAVDSRRLGPARLITALLVAGLVAMTLDLRRALIWLCAILACECWMWAVTGPFARQAPSGNGRRLAYMGSALCGCATWIGLSLAYWFDSAPGSPFIALLIWSALLLNAISFAFRSNLALVMFAGPVSLAMVATPILAPRLSGPHQLMAVVGLVIVAVYAAISAARNVRAASALAETTQALEKARATAQEANEAKSAFLATMSHEIRTPLNSILGMTQAMSRAPLPAEQRERLDVVRQGGEILLVLLNDILDLARIETGRLVLENGTVDFAALAQVTEAAFRPQALEKAVALDAEVAPEAMGGWRGDPARIRQILFNLVSNAVKFTAMGRVSVRIGFGPEGLVMTISDTGPGIPEASLPTLFDRFVQVDASTTRRFGGSGLGLAICRELAELMGGGISVRSTLGRGSVFTVVLPLQRAPEPAIETAPEVAAPEASSAALRILAAEDNAMNRLVLKTLLEPMGFEVAFAVDGAEAVRAWRDGAWDLILMDVQMPVMDGPEAARAIRALEASAKRPRTPIVALTANAMTHQHADYLAAGMDQVVAKPLQLPELLAAIDNLAGT